MIKLPAVASLADLIVIAGVEQALRSWRSELPDRCLVKPCAPRAR